MPLACALLKGQALPWAFQGGLGLEPKPREPVPPPLSTQHPGSVQDYSCGLRTQVFRSAGEEGGQQKLDQDAPFTRSGRHTDR